MNCCADQKNKLLSKPRILFATALVGGTLLLSIDGNHYWHDIRFLFAASKIPMAKIISGYFNPHQFGGEISLSSASGFYLTKILHISILKCIYLWIPPDRGGFTISLWLSYFYLSITILVCLRLFRQLFSDDLRAWLAVLFIFLIPITPYLAGKLLSETPALLGVTACVLMLNSGLRCQGLHAAGYVIASGFLLTLTALARFDFLICFTGFVAATFFNGNDLYNRKKILRQVSITYLIAGLNYWIILTNLRVNPEVLWYYFDNFINSGEKSNLVSLVGILSFGGVGYFFALAGVFNLDRKSVRFYLIWLITSAGPMIAICSFYMIEPRYLISGLLPLIGLGALGLEMFWEHFKRSSVRIVIGMSLLILAIGGNALIIPMMPYELNRTDLMRCLDRIVDENPNAIILIPWAYSDFNFLHVLKPNLPVYNVNSPISGNRPIAVNENWRKRLLEWYGPSYLYETTRLNLMIEEAPVYYLGWEKYPPVAYVSRMASRLGLGQFAKIIESIPLKNHLSQSWIWHSSDYALAPAGTCGQYRFYRVSKK